jgi:predicted DNA-binding transcriptional regulator AlpA
MTSRQLPLFPEISRTVCDDIITPAVSVKAHFFEPAQLPAAAQHSAPAAAEKAAASRKPAHSHGQRRQASQKSPQTAAIVLRVEQVALRYGVSKPTIWRWVKDNPGFPAPVHIGPGTTAGTSRTWRSGMISAAMLR